LLASNGLSHESMPPRWSRGAGPTSGTVVVRKAGAADEDSADVDPAGAEGVRGGGGMTKRKRDGRLAGAAAVVGPINAQLVKHLWFLVTPRPGGGAYVDPETARMLEKTAGVLERTLVRVACGTTLAHALGVASAADVPTEVVGCVEVGPCWVLYTQSVCCFLSPATPVVLSA